MSATPVQLAVPAERSTDAGGSAVLGGVEWAMLIAAAVAAALLVAVRLSRPVSEPVRARRAFRKLGRRLGLKAADRETIAAMGAASSIEPNALLISERALRMSRIASLAATERSGALSSERIRSACAALGVD